MEPNAYHDTHFEASDMPMTDRHVHPLRATALLAATLLLTSVAHAQSRPDDPRARDAEVMAAIQKAEARPLAKLAAARTEPDTSGFDVRKYTIRCNVDFANR